MKTTTLQLITDIEITRTYLYNEEALEKFLELTGELQLPSDSRFTQSQVMSCPICKENIPHGRFDRAVSILDDSEEVTITWIHCLQCDTFGVIGVEVYMGEDDYSNHFYNPQFTFDNPDSPGMTSFISDYTAEFLESDAFDATIQDLHHQVADFLKLRRIEAVTQVRRIIRVQLESE